MNTRVEIKEQAKAAFKSQYWMSVAMTVIIMVATGILNAALPKFSGTVLSYFLVFPLTISVCFFFIKIYTGKMGDIQDIGRGFSPYGRNIGAMFWMTLWLILWSLLFIIPGIIKFFSYMFTPYLLAEHDKVGAKEALKISMKITEGHRMDLFIFYLSFIGWFILSGLTCGILYIFYVGPYFTTALSGYYVELKQMALNKGIINLTDLGEEDQAINEIEIDMNPYSS